MHVGVSENLAVAGYIPTASTQVIARKKALSGGEGEAQSEPEKRGEVRVRNSVSLCTPSFSLGSGSNRVMMVGGPAGEQSSASVFSYCNNPLGQSSGGGVP